MSMRRIVSVAVAVCLSVALAHAQQTTTSPAPSAKPAAATLTGTWTGTFKASDDPGKQETAMVVLKQEGDVLTGTAGPDANQQWAIAKGKIATTKEGTGVTFEVTGDGGMTIQFDLKVVDGHLKGGAKAERNGEKKSAEIDLVRAK